MDCNEPVALQDFDILLHEKDGEMIRKMEILVGVGHYLQQTLPQQDDFGWDYGW